MLCSLCDRCYVCPYALWLGAVDERRTVVGAEDRGGYAHDVVDCHSSIAWHDAV